MMVTANWQLWSGGAFVGVLIVAVVFWLRVRTQARAALNAAIAAQIARDSDELDLDKRLGPRNFVEVESIYGERLQIAYRQSGHGPDIICVHGIGASMVIYRRMVPWLANDYRLTCIDFPGFGASSKPRNLSYTLDEQATHFARTIEALDLKAPLAVASSMGGAITLKTALDNSDLFRGIVALAPAVDPRRVPVVLLPLAKYADRFHRLNSLAAIRATAQQVVTRRELLTPALLNLYHEPFRDQGDSSSAMLKAFALLADSRMPILFRTMKTPLLIVRGLRDRLVKQAACEDLSRLVENSKLITHMSAGHHIMEDEPEFTAHEIRKFDASL